MNPTPEQLSSPRGTPLTALDWADAQTRVAEAGDFLLATTDPDGRPHVVPVLADLFPAKYPWWHPVVRDGEFYDPADTDPRHVYALEPAQVFAFGKEHGFTATRWRF